MTQEPQKNSTVLIVIAIIGVIGTIVASTIGVIGNYNIEKFRQESELTRVALVFIVTQGGATQVSMASTISAPTSTLYPTASSSPKDTNTPMPIPTLTPTIPTPTHAPFAFSDNFNTGIDPGWRIVDGQPVIKDGWLRGTVTLETGKSSLSNYTVDIDFDISRCCNAFLILLEFRVG